jgi:hypothetical protein
MEEFENSGNSNMYDDESDRISEVSSSEISIIDPDKII